MVLQEKVQELKTRDGASSAAGQGAWDFALTTCSLVDGLSVGAGYGEAAGGEEAGTLPGGDKSI